jgi:hypothetical protein
MIDITPIAMRLQAVRLVDNRTGARQDRFRYRT